MPARNHGVLKARPRGAAMIETVCVLSFILALLFGCSQIVLAGFYQLQLDAATFFYSHSYALTGTVPYAQMQKVLPAINTSQVTTVASPPPNTEASDPNGEQVLGEYTTGGVPGGPVSADSNRYGGASIIRPQQIATQGTLALPSFDLSIFNGPVTMTSGDIEGRSMVANHDDDATGYDYNSTQADGNLVSPDTVSGDDQDVPPYYFAHAYMRECNNDTVDFDCANAGTTLWALGLAEYLMDASNASASNGNYDNSSNGIGLGQTFGAMTCHQRVYAAIAQTLTQGAYASYAASQSQSNNALVQYALELNDYDVNVNAISPAGDYGTRYPQHPLAVLPGQAC